MKILMKVLLKTPRIQWNKYPKEYCLLGLGL